MAGGHQHRQRGAGGEQRALPDRSLSNGREPGAPRADLEHRVGHLLHDRRQAYGTGSAVDLHQGFVEAHPAAGSPGEQDPRHFRGAVHAAPVRQAGCAQRQDALTLGPDEAVLGTACS